MSSANLIEQVIKLKGELQSVYYELQKKKQENRRLIEEIEKLKSDKLLFENESERPSESSIILKENRSLLAQVKQMKRDSIGSPIIIKSKSVHRNSIDVQFEVEKLLAHRGKKGLREFKVRWKNYGAKHDSWQKADSLNCPHVLNSYLKKRKLVL